MKILLLAGEESGVLYSNRIREELRRRDPSVEIRGYGDYGFETIDLAVIGFVPVLLRIGYFLRVKRTIERAIVEWRPDVVCTVDYPGLNLKLAAFAKAHGVKAVHVVCPQVWAWHQSRIPKIEAALDRLCCFFPFEPRIFREGLAEFVGHPLLDEMQAQSLGDRRGKGGTTLALLPGSRKGEISKHMPVLLEVVHELRKTRELRVVIPAASERAHKAILAAIAKSPYRGETVEITAGQARQALAEADAAVVASGTATLEAAIIGCPTVLVYKVGWLFAAIMRRMIKGVRHVGLINVIAEKSNTECPMPELLQEAFTAENILGYLRLWLADSAANSQARTALASSVRLLQSDGSAIARIADLVLGI